MIVVFVVDTSPSMGQPIAPSRGKGNHSMLSRLDLAKMAVEDLVKGMNRRVQEHNVFLQHQPPAVQKSMVQIGLGYCPANQYLLLSTSRQHTDQPATAACGAGGRLLVGFGPDNIYGSNHHQHGMDSSQAMGHDPMHSGDGSMHGASSNAASFQRELKQLQAASWDPSKATGKNKGFPDDAGGAGGLNTALSAGLQLLSRYRLQVRETENWAMGRLPNPAMVLPNGAFASHALQSGCLVLLTDGACLRKPPAEGGGSLQLQPGNMPLREWYKEPFRWDQRIVCLGVGGASQNNVSSSQFLHPRLRALCEVTGGCLTLLQSTISLPTMTERLLRTLAPPLPRELPMADPLKSPVTAGHSATISTNPPNGTSSFINGGPVCCFQAIEGDMDGSGGANLYRAMLLYVPCPSPQMTPTDVPDTIIFHPPMWCIPENYFPNRKLDTLPPRSAQPLLMISRFPSKMGNKSFEPTILMKQLNRLDQLILSTRQLQQSAQPGNQAPAVTVKMLHRDVYICEWVSVDDRPPKAPQPNVYGGSEYYPVIVQDAGRPTNDDTNYLHIGILHAPSSTSTLATSTQSASSRPFSTLTMLPPEPQILVPLLLKAADAEHRAFKKATQGNSNMTAENMAAVSRSVQVDETWKQDLRNYISRLPPYYQVALKRGLRSVLPTSLHQILATALANEAPSGGGGADGSMSSSSLSMHCYSKACFQKIRGAEQVSRDNNERLERQEVELRGVSKLMDSPHQQQQPQPQQTSSRPQLQRSNSQNNLEVGYGQYDPRSSTESFLSALRSLPAPWLVGVDSKKRKRDGETAKNDTPTGKGKLKSDTAKSSNAAKNDVAPAKSDNEDIHAYHTRKPNAMEILGDLPADCLMAYYESRRRWIFGGSGLTTRGLIVEGVSNDGGNVQRCGANPNDFQDQSLLSFAGVGVSTLNETTVAKMGDYRERLLWSRAPVVGYGSNDSCGVASTTAADGSPKWSVDDDALPLTFFDPKTGAFVDSVQTRVRARLMVNFGNAYKDKRADSLVPEKYQNQRPSNHHHDTTGEIATPPGSPPHDSYSSSVEEGEAIFTKSPPPKSPPHSSNLSLSPRPPPAKPPKEDNKDSNSVGSTATSEPDDSSTGSSGLPPPPPTKRAKLEGEFKASLKPTPKQPPKKQRPKPGISSDKTPLVSTPMTPPTAPPKLKSSPGSAPSSSSSPRPPPPPVKSPKPTPGPPPKGTTAKRPPPPPGTKRQPPPPSLNKKPSFSLAPSKPLPSFPLRRPSSLLSGASIGQSSSTDSADGGGGKSLPAPPLPKPTKLEATTSGGSVGSASSAAGGGPIKPPPPKPKASSAPPPPKRSNPAKPPPPKPPPQQQPPQPQPTSEPTKTLVYTERDKKPDVELPAGWMCVWSKSQKRWYFFDTRSNRSVWQWPPPAGSM
ncbi:Integrator complex subunit 6-like [Seminavis robusta]|uniref:Integrator complex subunit 6-like n=1 Tax=Seminavis robusta TaxID=568900 RepID=A0A9N8DDR6_9STRA|nr:Integrator complex subunit 6-like [Seminavis robusta]|eukprot:Sro100_g051280.1 Integrator complex subunit 6-like (1406) ;mRNA; r:62157-66374